MPRKIKMQANFATFEECFSRFMIAKKAKGLADKTLQTYYTPIRNFSTLFFGQVKFYKRISFIFNLIFVLPFIGLAE